MARLPAAPQPIAVVVQPSADRSGCVGGSTTLSSTRSPTSGKWRQIGD
ncbi:MAG: hypothetical protein R2911_39195 [Caldilineaceae bacterium]